jgi:hypothetical protein
MTTSYCPSSRTFYRLRSVLMRELGLHRHALRPSQRLADVVPEHRRREVWKQLRREGLRLPRLRLSQRLLWSSLAHVLHLAMEIGVRFQNMLGFLIAVPLGLLTSYVATRRWAVHVNPRGPLTVRDAVLYLTSFREEMYYRYRSTSLREALFAGYHPTREEIELRVRIIVAANLGVALERVTPEMRFDRGPS